jgi:alpha-glucosidase
MNEPAVFSPPTATMPLTVRHDNEGEPTDHREIHNVYGQLMSRATFEGLSRLRPRERPFVLTRATYAGGQRYSAVWPGDNVSDWPSLGQGLAVLMGMGLSGFPFVGTDIGGFAETPSAELFTRWLQVGVFHPFMRTHTTFGTPDQEPWSYGARHEAVNRRAIELRYELLPQIYDVMKEASETGVPALRPLFLEFPDDPQTWGIQDQFLLGHDLLVAPVLREAQTERSVYLPAGDWYDFWTGRLVKGGRSVSVPVTLESIPIYVRAGGFVFTQPVVQSTGEMPGQPLRVSVYPAARSESELYEDDGESVDYKDGVFARRRFSQRREPGCVAVDAAAATGSWRPAARDVVLRVRADGEPARVQLDGAPLARSAGAGPGWSYGEDGFVELRMKDKPEAFSVLLETAVPRASAGRSAPPCAAPPAR